jgi:PAS domain S-box-containing protein
MSDSEKSGEQLTAELDDLRRRIAQLEKVRVEGSREDDLQESRADCKAILDAVNDAIFVHDMDTGAILDVNEEMCRMYGYSRQEALSLTVEDLSAGSTPYSMDEALTWIKAAVGGEPQLFEWQAKGRGGKLFWVEVNLKRSSVSGRDCLLAVVRDISDRKRAESELRAAREELEARVAERTAELVKVNEELKREITERKRVEGWLRDSERRYRVLVDEVPDIIFILDHEGRFTYCNTQIEPFLRHPVKDVLETSLADYMSPEDRHRIKGLLSLPLDAIWDEEVCLVDARGERRFSRIRCKALMVEHNGPIRYEGVMRDITIRRRLEEELKASRKELLEKIKIIDDLYTHIVESGKARAIAEHTAEVAHELRQPLAIIGGFVRRMARTAAPGEESNDLDRLVTFRIIISEIQRLERILDRLIRFTRHETLRLDLVDPNEIIERVLEVYDGMMKKRNLRLEKNLGKEVGEILLDPDRFEEVMRNLVANAVEASYSGERVLVESGVSIPSCKAQETGGLECENYFEVKVKNFGPIIQPDEVQQIFSPFYSTKAYGTGIGLRLSKKIVEDHGGSISVHSDEDGTVFTVWLPIKDQDLVDKTRSVPEN